MKNYFQVRNMYSVHLIGIQNNILLDNALQNFQIKIVLNHETCSEAFQVDMKPKSPTVM